MTYEENFMQEYAAHYPSVDLSPKAARQALEGVESRFVEYHWPWYHGSPALMVEIFYQGSWRSLGRTDLKDDVRTARLFGREDDHGACVEFFRGRIHYGARVTPDGFYVVDSFSDG